MTHENKKEETMNENNRNPNAYSQLFCGEKPTSDEQKETLDRLEAKEWDRVNAMTEDEKIEEFNRIMGRG